MKPRSLKVGVIGAGLGGLALAAGLARRGVDVHVFEQTREFARVGAGIQISSNTMNVLQGLGLDRQISDRGFHPQKYESRDWDTGVVTNQVILGDKHEQRFGQPHVVMHRGDLHSGLLSAVPAERIHLGRKFRDISQKDGKVTFTFEDGSSETTDILIACDGVHSRVREQVLQVVDANFSGYISQRAVYPTALLPADLMERLKVNHFTKWWGTDRHVVSYFVTSALDEIYFATSYQSKTWESESWSAIGDLQEMRDLFEGFHPDIKIILDKCPKVYKLAVFEREPMARWVDDHIAVLGDAAHPMTPYMAQGGAMALEDAAVLTRCLTELDVPPADALKIYQNTRIARASKAQKISHGNTWLRRSEDSAWVYEYNAWKVPLADTNTIAA
jgi:salicylate hydroxylase/6-hydroxynicotinate 3-monooxygenase